jgi:hypothetical protein
MRIVEKPANDSIDYSKVVFPFSFVSYNPNLLLNEFMGLIWLESISSKSQKRNGFNNIHDCEGDCNNCLNCGDEDGE